MMREGFSGDARLACSDCGSLGAFAFDGAALCAECYQVRGSSCAAGGKESSELGMKTAADDSVERANASAPLQPEPDRHRLNPNCCYQACAQCSSIRRLREFRAKFPQDWAHRLAGSPRLVAVAREGN